MVTAKKCLLVLVPLALLCATASYVLLYISPETLSPIVVHNLPSSITNKIWPAQDPHRPPSLGGPGAAVAAGPEPTPTPAPLDLPDLPDLRALCARTSWDANLAIHCHSRCGPHQDAICGGLNNARDRLQTCLRLAVDAGATTVVIPALAPRSEKTLAMVNPAAVPGAEDEAVELCADAWFATAALRDALATHCPQTRVQVACRAGSGEDGDADVAARLGAGRVLEVPWRPIGGAKYDARVGHSFRETVQALLRDSSSSSNDNATHQIQTGDGDGGETRPTTSTTLIEVGDTYMAWDYRRSAEQTRLFKDLFQTVSFSPRLLALGRRLLALSAPSLSLSPRPQESGTPPPSYVGVHLRGEDDWPAEWGSLEDQARLYGGALEHLRRRDEGRGVPPARTLYVSCGNRSAIQYFRERVGPLGYDVFDKWSLLEAPVSEKGEKTTDSFAPSTSSSSSSPRYDGNNNHRKEHDDEEARASLLATIEALSFDEKAVVEYEPLVRGRYFLGISYSSMSSVVATARTLGEPGDFFDDYITNGGGEAEKGIKEVRGNEHTGLIYVNIE